MTDENETRNHKLDPVGTAYECENNDGLIIHSEYDARSKDTTCVAGAFHAQPAAFARVGSLPQNRAPPAFIVL